MIETLVEAAREARERAYAPYSGFRVGAAILTDSGEIFSGCNVENGSYGLTICAERSAVAAAVTAGHRRFERLVVVADRDEAVSPCGACRQVLAEFGPDLEVVGVGEGETVTWTVGSLLPSPFVLEERPMRSGDR